MTVYVVSCIQQSVIAKGPVIMTKHFFTREQILILSQNNYVASVTREVISFTPEFKSLFYDRYMSGETPREIMVSCGIDPKLIGEKRLEGIRYNICKQLERNGDFEPKYRGRIRYLEHQPANPNESTEATVKRLEHELAYTRQEVEFLKKLQMADMEARRQWESKHQPE
jgi:hypothetical protein